MGKNFLRSGLIGMIVCSDRLAIVRRDHSM
jgi:hypothetical protein